MDEQQWDERYAASDRIWSGRPNAALVAEASDLEPGTVLDVGCGEGADAVWLAERGWRVTGLDVSGVALERGRAWASENGVEVAWVKSGLLEAGLAPGTFDLVTVLYSPLQRTPDHAAEHLVAGLVAPGGRLLVVHHVPQPGGHDGHRPDFGSMVAPESVRPVLGEGWTIEVDEVRDRTVAGGQGAHHHEDAVLLARRVLRT